jgi:hypothetical protein
MNDFIEILKPTMGAIAGAGTTYVLSNWDLLRSITRLRHFEGSWYGFFRDPNDIDKIREEEWNFDRFGRVQMFRDGRPRFRGVLRLKHRKGYISVDSLHDEERLFIVFDQPNRFEDGSWVKCVWLGEDRDGFTSSGCGILSRKKPPLGEIKRLVLKLD